MSGSSKIFIRNRAAGYICNHVPITLRYIKSRQEHLVVTAVGKSFHTYSTSNLGLLAVSDPADEDIICLSANNNFTITSNDNVINLWKNATKLFKSFFHANIVNIVFPLGEFVIGVDESNLLKVWEIESGDVFLDLTFDKNTFKISAVVHPSTYVNKLLLASRQGLMQLWNIKSSKLIYTFDGWNSPILVLQQAPALDVIAVGLENGKIILHNIKFDKTLFEFSQDWGPVTSITFRTDGPPIMATGTDVGHIVLWDLDEQKVSSQILKAHKASVATVEFLPNEPLLITSSEDNSLKMWIFDQLDNHGRLLKFRDGHSDQPIKVRFHGNNGNNVISSGSDSTLRVFSTLSDTLNYSMGKAVSNKKAAKRNKEFADNYLLPPIIEFSCETAREKEWDNIAAVHKDYYSVTTWSFHRKCMGDLKLIPSQFKGQIVKDMKLKATTVCITHCGNFVLIGYNTGNVEKFNIQSGIHRNTYGTPKAHKDPIRGIAVDPLNQFVITGCARGIMKFWNFKETSSNAIRLLKKLNFGEGITFFRINKDSLLLAIVLEDFTIALLDIETKNIIRRLRGHTGEITDGTFSPNARWFITSSIDSTIRTWDLPTASTVDIFKVDPPCISLSMSPTGHMLVTVHVESLGIYLWLNKTLFSVVSLRPIKESDSIPEVLLPESRGAQDVIEVDNDNAEIDEVNSITERNQIDNLITLSDLAPSRWVNLLDINLIKERNKPKEAPKASIAAPFFLPTLPSLNFNFDLSKETENDELKRNILEKLRQRYTEFGSLLDATINTNDFTPAVDKLKSMNPAAIDFEINSLSIDAAGSISLMRQFIELLKFMFRTNCDFELCQAYLGLFIKVHGETVATTPELNSELAVLLKLQQTMWEILRKDIIYCLSVVDFLK